MEVFICPGLDSNLSNTRPIKAHCMSRSRSRSGTASVKSLVVRIHTCASRGNDGSGKILIDRRKSAGLWKWGYCWDQRVVYVCATVNLEGDGCLMGPWVVLGNMGARGWWMCTGARWFRPRVMIS